MSKRGRTRYPVQDASTPRPIHTPLPLRLLLHPLLAKKDWDRRFRRHRLRARLCHALPVVAVITIQ